MHRKSVLVQLCRFGPSAMTWVTRTGCSGRVLVWSAGAIAPVATTELFEWNPNHPRPLPRGGHPPRAPGSMYGRGRPPVTPVAGTIGRCAIFERKGSEAGAGFAGYDAPRPRGRPARPRPTYFRLGE